MREFTAEEVNLILQRANEVNRASVFEGSTQRPFEVQSMTLDLSTARLETDPLRIGFPFKSVFVRSATDVYVEVSMRPISRDSFQSAVPLKYNDSLVFERQISGAFLHWTAQASKSITLLFFVSSEFRSGSQVSQTGGGVSIIDGSSFSTAVVTLGAASATLVAAQDTTRKQCTIQNNSGNDIWFGGSSVSSSGANLGYKVAANDTFIWRNTAALYAYSAAGGDVLKVTEL